MVEYSWDYATILRSIFIIFPFSVSLLANCILLYIIFTTAAGDIGSYRYLLAFSTICNITTTLILGALQPFVHMTPSGFYMFPRREIVVHEVSYDILFCVIFIKTFYQSFLVLAFQFFYRYKAVTRCTIKSQIVEMYDIDLSDPHRGFIRMNSLTNEMCWSTETVMTLLHCIGLFGTAAIMIIFCMNQTSKAIKTINPKFTTSRNSHRELFRSLLIQTFARCLLSYTPFSIMQLCGVLTGISLGRFGNILILSSALTPSVDAFIVLYSIAKFRVAAFRLFRLQSEDAQMEASDTTIATLF